MKILMTWRPQWERSREKEITEENSYSIQRVYRGDMQSSFLM